MSYDFMEMAVPPPEGPICDFCSGPNVRWAYPCRDHQRKTERVTAVSELPDGSLGVDQLDLNSFASGGWAACSACHALIQRGDRHRLARRSAKRLLRRDLFQGAWPLDDAIAHVRRLHDQFWTNRLGPPVPATPDGKDPTR